MNQHSKPRGIRKTILNSTAAFAGMAAVLSPGMAAAQDAPAVDEEEVIVVTGTRIQRPDFQFSNPVVSTTAEEIANSGTTNLLDYLETVPALANSVNGTEGFPDPGYAGVDLLNLRNLGFARTLVLVDGRRHVPGFPGSAAVDVSTIPTDLVERVDVLTGGASAIYGADGVSGVVNFIMRDDFEGLRLRAEAGAPGEEGQETQYFSATWGQNFAEGRGNISGSFDYSNETALKAFDREFGRRDIRFTIDPRANPVAFYNTYEGLVWFSSGMGSAVDVDGFGDPLDPLDDDFYIADFNGDGSPWDFGEDFDPPAGGVFDSDFTYGLGGDGTPTAGYTQDLLPEVERFGVNLFAHYDITNRVTLFGSVKVNTSEALNIIQPSFDYALAINAAENPYVPTTIRDAAALNGEDYVFLSRDHLDLGYQGERLERDTSRAVVGLRGELSDHVNFELSYTAGQLTEHYVSLQTKFDDRFAAALDVIDPDGAGPLGPTCRINVDPLSYLSDFNIIDRQVSTGQRNLLAPVSFGAGECVPLNLFGNGSPSAEAVDWIMNDTVTDTRLRQQVFSASLNGDLGSFLQLPGGSIGWAGGVEWRRESMVATPEQLLQIGITTGGGVAETRGAIEVREAFVEANFPILSDMPFAESLNLDWAHRHSEYSSTGATNAWKFGLQWAPIEDISFRATLAEAVRAPNIGELYAPQGTVFDFIDDPCDPTYIGLGADPALRAANCAVLLTAAGADPNTYVDPFAAFTKQGRAGGNPDLRPETAETFTVGAIFRPRFLNNFVFSADYYDILLIDAIRNVDPQDIADGCVDAPTVNNDFCTSITRVSGGGGAGGIFDYLTGPLNVASYTTRGIDFTVAYRFDPVNVGLPDIGAFDLRLIGNNLLELEFVNTAGSTPDPDNGEIGAPDWQASFDVTWSRGPLELNYAFNWTSDVLRFDQVDVSNSLTNNGLLLTEEYWKYAEGLNTHNIQARYSFNDHFELYGGVNNATDEMPGVGLGNYPVDGNGRFFYLGVVATY